MNKISYKFIIAANIASILIIAFVLIQSYRETLGAEWIVLGQKYKAKLHQNATEDNSKASAAAFKVQLNQIVLPDRRVDRCISCHIGVEDPNMSEAEQPFTKHPGNYLDSHNPNFFGCVVCHQGQGRAIDKKLAHGETDHWEFPLLKNKFIQASCGNCHINKDLEQTPILNKGRKLFAERGCYGCHKLNDQGGTVGPELTHIGMKSVHQMSFAHVEGDISKENWFIEHFKDPQKVMPGSKMIPMSNLSDEELDALTAYMLSLKYPNFPARFVPEAFKPIESHDSIGAENNFQRFCATCHGDNAEGKSIKVFEHVVPSLKQESFLYIASKEFIEKTVYHGRDGRIMSAWNKENGGLNDDEIEEIAALILSWEKKPPTYNQVMSANRDPNLGKNLFMSRCGTCHGINLEGGVGPSLKQQDLLTVASDKFLYETITKGRSNTAMPSWYFLDAKELAGLISYIRSFQTELSKPLDESFVAKGNLETGKQLFAQTCAKCHGNYGQGAVGTAILNPNFMSVASDAFIKNSLMRGRSSTAMLSFSENFQGIASLSDASIGSIIYFMRQYKQPQLDHIPTNILAGGSPTIGKDLFKSYCAQCHGSNGEGKIGPSLRNKTFLNTATNGFIYATVANGRPGTPMRAWAKGAQGLATLSQKEIENIISFIRTWEK